MIKEIKTQRSKFKTMLKEIKTQRSKFKTTNQNSKPGATKLSPNISLFRYLAISLPYKHIILPLIPDRGLRPVPRVNHGIIGKGEQLGFDAGHKLVKIA